MDSRNRAVNFIDMPSRMNALWGWVCALYAYDYNDPKPLSELIRIGGEIPPEFIGAIADIVAGLRKPNKKAAVKLKVPASEYMKIAASVSTILGLVDTIKYDAIFPGDVSEKPGACSVGEYHAQEPEEVLKQANQTGRETKQRAADHFGISLETVENMIRELRKKIKEWPDV